MTKQLTFLLLFSGHFLFAQNIPQPTQFDKFVSNSKIEWAAYASDTFNFTKADLNNLLLSKLNKKAIKASLPVESRTAGANQIKYSILDSIDYAFYGDDTDLLMDSLGNEVRQKKLVPLKNNTNFTITEVTQILYIEKGELKSYIPFITPTLPVFVSSGKYIGERFYFTSCFNYKYNSKSSKKSKLTFLLQTKKMIKLDPPQQTDQLKTMYGKNLLQTLWQYIQTNKIEISAIDNNRKLLPAELNNYLSSTQPVISPIYDSVGNILKYNIEAPQIDPNKFTDVQLVQDWYYDSRKNKVFSYITEMLLYLSKPDKKEEHEKLPVIRLIFK